MECYNSRRILGRQRLDNSTYFLGTFVSLIVSRFGKLLVSLTGSNIRSAFGGTASFRSCGPKKLERAFFWMLKISRKMITVLYLIYSLNCSAGLYQLYHVHQISDCSIRFQLASPEPQKHPPVPSKTPRVPQGVHHSAAGK